MTFEETLAYIHSRPKSGKKDSQARMAALLSALKHPEKHLPAVIHVTGTNGKGSVATMLSAIGQADGLKVGLFTSPYIIAFNDRFQINGQDISDDELTKITGRVKSAADQVEKDSDGELRPTEFEVVTAIMFCYFSESALDLAVIEVGIGGLYDSTNLMPQKEVAVITSVALDHQAMLGDTLAEIAKQKAGIILEKQPTVIGPNIPKEALSVIKKECLKKESSLVLAERTFLKSNLHGEFQEENKATAVTAYRVFRPNVEEKVLQEGLSTAFIPGRFEEVLPDVYLDGAHNPAGLSALRKTIDKKFDQPVLFVIGALADKHIETSLRTLSDDSKIDLFFFDYEGLPGRAGMKVPDFLTNQRLCSVDEAVELAHNSHRPLVFTGSLYFISDVRRHLCQKKKHLVQN
ncbi:bifunctional folylpolyglutamate synthase/dihydrofolate synthase [Fructobacillus sp. CRL 2054]|uniref:bifunctional folylpolyglutamate synthase/dihydrofolate synthase n=1 Tax=Fructobacillus sp. CRL 2054 TaxID=2763007 RepID=UPI002379561F|nr:folylpolyglutamate synthase/dihydrofolate synthase family protein [Fructobacillus sp. CRL 2054]MDD9138754.1 bifunctional folylpolyglutamate synthase/dihydrofolate synthase [Fructobacillus sp. CRL 2054]